MTLKKYLHKITTPQVTMIIIYITMHYQNLPMQHAMLFQQQKIQKSTERFRSF